LVEEIIKKYSSVKLVKVSLGGQVEALNAGVSVAQGEILAFTDDDCLPQSDWIERINDYFTNNPELGGVGGRDRVYIGKNALFGKRRVVGKITWYGRIIGNHHLGFGGPREVDHLKGSNMAFRKKALDGLSFDVQLRGEGAQYRNDMAICLAVKNRGYKVVYDPQVMVEHFYSARFEKDKRGNFDRNAIENAAFNETLISLKYLNLKRRMAYLIYSFILGNLFTPGILFFLFILIGIRRNAWIRFKSALTGRSDALYYYAKPTV
jgi:GT2 family glycosyltransferase